MDTFAKAVAECRRKESSRILKNASIEHAKLLFENLIELGSSKRENIEIVSGEVFPPFYDDLISPAKSALHNGSSISLLVTNTGANLEESKFVKTIIEGGGRVWKANDSMSIPHFIVVGGKRFRFETDHAQTKAIASFNNEDIGGTLTELFKNVVASGQAREITK